MPISYLHLTNFRSYPKARFELHPELNLIVGPNGSGKTNLLEAIYMLTETKSFRAPKKATIRRGEEFFRLEYGSYPNKSASYAYRPDGAPQKLFSLGGGKINQLDFRFLRHSVLFEPNHLRMIGGSPRSRRRYLDGILCKTDQSYLKAYINYEKVLRQRNALLKTHSLTAARQQIFAWDLKLVELATRLFLGRIKLVEYLNAEAGALYKQIAKDKSAIKLEYRGDFAKKEYADRLLRALNANLQRDVLLGSTSAGPHRDDLGFTINGQPFKLAASRGEERTLVLALKLLELKYVESNTDQKPTLLLDDVLSELDPRRQRFLLEILGGYQTIVTTTDIKNIEAVLPAERGIIRL